MPALKKSPWILHYDASSCNGCDIEVLACLTPRYDVERLGVINTGNPKHADIFLVTGAVNRQNIEVIRNLYSQLPEPKVVVAVGICAASGGVFRECYNVSGGVDKVIPVDVYVPGCAVRPEAIIDGVVKALDVLAEKRRIMREYEGRIDKLIVVRAEATDLPAILALQKIAYSSEAEIYSDASIPALRQTLPELKEDFDRQVFLKGIVNGKIVASIRGHQTGDVTHISRLIVHPYFQGNGMGTRMVHAMEDAFPYARQCEVFTGDRSLRNQHLYKKLGYQVCRTEPHDAHLEWVYMRKDRS